MVQEESNGKPAPAGRHTFGSGLSRLASRIQSVTEPMNATTFRCQCRGGSCARHSPEEPCPNEAVPPIAVVHDMVRNQPVPESAYGLCEECHAANMEQEP